MVRQLYNFVDFTYLLSFVNLSIAKVDIFFTKTFDKNYTLI